MASRVSKTYGDAYVSLQVENGHLVEAMEEVKAAKAVFDTNEELRKFLYHPKITKDEKMKVMKSIFQERVSQDMTGFLMIIVKKGRFQELHSIFEYILEQMKKIQGIGSLKVTSAFSLSEEQKEQIKQKVLQITSYKELEILYEIDASIIGGLILCMDDRVVDDSIRTKLETMGKHLSEIQI